MRHGKSVFKAERGDEHPADFFVSPGAGCSIGLLDYCAHCHAPDQEIHPKAGKRECGQSRFMPVLSALWFCVSGLTV
jgi:hypothetical protein